MGVDLAQVSNLGFTALVPAREGSKGIYRKNLQEIGEVSLAARAIRRAVASRTIDRVLVSTDDPEIARLAVEEGAEAPFLRPASLAADDTPMWDVVRHAWRHLTATASPAAEGLVLLQPTSPFVRPATIDAAVRRWRESRAPMLKAVRRVREHPDWMLTERAGLLVSYKDGPPGRRQDLPTLYIPCGAVYVYGSRALDSPQPPGAAAWIEVGWPESVDLDEPEDLHMARCLAACGHDERESVSRVSSDSRHDAG